MKPASDLNAMEMAEASTEQSPGIAGITSGETDIVVGLISYNSAETIRSAITATEDGLEKFSAGRKGLIINADGGSKDGTPELALDSVTDKKRFLQLSYPVYPVQKLAIGQYGLPGKANALLAIFNAAIERKASACVVLDSNVRSITPEWIEVLSSPVLDESFDFVSPCYVRHKYEGALINGVVYPLTRTLFGKRIQQPIGGEFALSMKLLNHLVRQPHLDSEAAGYGAGSIIDVWVTIQAACGAFRLAQANLGPRILSQSEPAPEVSSILVQTLGSVLAEMNWTAPVWQRIRGSEKIPSFGIQPDPAPEPQPVDVTPMLQAFRLGYQNLQDIWRMVLPPATLVLLKRMSLQPAEIFRFDDRTWARTVYDFALAWRTRVIDRDHLLRALTPLYLGWVASYVNSVRDANLDEARGRIEDLCVAFEAEKGYLISRWRWPDRFNP